MIRPRHIAVTAATLLTVGWGSCEMAGVAAAAPNCGGQHANPQPVPYTCNLPGIDITFQGVTRHFSAVVNADGVTVSATFTMSAPLPVDVPIRIVHHEGISGAGGLSDQSTGVIPAGSTTGTVTDSEPCRDGQLNVKAVFIGNGQSQGRVGGPWIQNGTNCLDIASTVPTTVTTPPSSAVPPTVASTIPGSPTPVESSAPSTVGGTHPIGVSGSLPATGSSAMGPAALGVTILGFGLLVLWMRRRPA